MEMKYTVRQAVEMTGIKSYVLRYWEEELELQIHRNELGHRYYTGYDVQLFLNIKELKKRGLQLRAIKNLIPQITASMNGFGETGVTLLEGEVQELEKPAQQGSDMQERSTVEMHRPENKKILEFQMILERLITQELQSQNEDEERCRSLDYAIRRQQMARKEAAAAAERRPRRKRKET
ncbi:helix-turn-helix domain-containing protein [Blautia sp. MSJ-19]|uniref:helix-turn-helix domain-containing protein n=1 Tax=Blautia sp. MSJ-19 TaxID=2841517 RepID=UPI001C0F0A78|nr:helix-turn-helix domain-containing protein [Blautia sp. MSJ-19]MBU5479613.1 helix-turn-helix domain-containing protein [Blautia sp. MSJ-19]